MIGKWQFIRWYPDVASEGEPVTDGYILDLKGNGHFTSDELNGYTGGTYTVIYNTGKNLKLVFQNSAGTKTSYKQLIEVQTNELKVFYSSNIPYPLTTEAYEGQVLTRIP